MDVSSNIKSYFLILRPINLGLVLLTLLSLRYFYLIPELNNSGLDILPNGKYILACLSIVITMAAGNVINDILDHKADLVNKPDKVIINKYISKPEATKYYIFLILLSLSLSLPVNTKLFLIILFTNIILLLYSLFLKRIMLLGNLVISSLSALIPILAIWLDVQHIFSLNNDPNIFYLYRFALVFSLLSFFGSLPREIIKDIEDLSGDKLINSKSLPIVIGSKYSKYISMFFIFILCGFILVYPPISANSFSFYYFLILVIIPLLVSVFKLRRAIKKSHYSEASKFIKISMFFTILFITLNGFLSYDIF